MGSSIDEDKRRHEVAAAIALMDTHEGLGLVVECEDNYLLTDAIRCYKVGADAATIFCAHAVCERDLAVLVEHSESAPGQVEKWGLGKFLDYCKKLELLPDDLLNRLSELNEHRKTLYHYGHSQGQSALASRTYDYIRDEGADTIRDAFREECGYDGRNKAIYSFAMARVLRQSALSALTTSLQLRSWLAGSGG